jgi:serine/threonine protein phosphatase Stp1
MTPAFRFNTVGVTHEGCVRKANEDSHAMRDEAGLWVVADGMGGHANGQWASSAIVAAVQAANVTGDFDHDASVIAGALHFANEQIVTTAKSNGVSMGSTVVALYLSGRRFACFWAGDSRIYLLRGGELHRLTRDHTQVQEMVDRGLLTAEEARRHPMSHVLSRAVGVQPELELEALADEAAPRDIFLLCSDGLTGVVTEPEIAERLSQFPPRAACQRLLDLVLSRGAPDNVTMVAVACEELTALALQPA